LHATQKLNALSKKLRIISIITIPILTFVKFNINNTNIIEQNKNLILVANILDAPLTILGDI
jgi:hypothetical protein